MAITVLLADDYFLKHLSGGVWTRYSTEQRQTGIDYAKRFFASLSGGDEVDDDTTTNADFPRPDCAVYEQALYMLRNSPDMPDIESPTPSELFPEKESGAGPTRQSMFKVCEAARIFLTQGGITLSRA